MAQSALVSIYGVNSNSLSGTQGQLMGFPANGILVRPVNIDSTFNGVISGVTMNSVIQLLPGGLVVNQPLYYTPKTVSEVVTICNA